MSEMVDAKAKLEKAPTAMNVQADNLLGTMARNGTPGTETQGTGFNTKQHSGAINQSKENIILSEQSSAKQID